MSKPIRKLLIANRAEIAVRIILAARELGIATVAVYSEADKDSMHASLADEAIAIGPGEASRSYLDSGKILSAAMTSGADAIHPGYGFLSERPEFSEACRDSGLVFVGPSPQAMRLLGSKMQAKALAVKSGVPVVPGFFEPGSDAAKLKTASEAIGYPVLLKASAGGGGRGMREVRSSDEFEGEFSIATSEAIKAFGDGAMMVEKLIESPRHVEVQVLADLHGNIACLFERECSIQRRHQKLIEESPSPLAGYESMWPAMRDAAQTLIRAAGYVGAGTVEFIVDPLEGAFFFLEVNARLQVEHPVTEAVTGIDLVQWQLRIVQGEALGVDSGLLAGDRRRQIGHAIEARVVAEDPSRGFLPSVGPILGWIEPKGPGIRVDTGFSRGAEVSGFYDSLLAKVIVHAEDRPSAIRKLVTALEDFHILGVKTNIGFLLRVLQSDQFISGVIDTGMLDREFSALRPEAVPAELALIVANANPSTAAIGHKSVGIWDLADGFRNAREDD